MKRYKLKHKYLKGFEFSNYNYLNYDKLQEQFCLESEEETEDYQTIFSDEEIEKFNFNKALKEKNEAAGIMVFGIFVGIAFIVSGVIQ